MKKLLLSPLILAVAVTWAAGAGSKSSVGSMSGGSTHGTSGTGIGTGAIVNGRVRSFTTPAELKTTSISSGYGGSGPTKAGNASGAGTTSTGSSGPTGLNFGFGRPLHAPVIKKKAQPKSKP